MQYSPPKQYGLDCNLLFNLTQALALVACPFSGQEPHTGGSTKKKKDCARLRDGMVGTQVEAATAVELHRGG